MRIIAAVVIAVGLTSALAWLPAGEVWRKVAHWGFYVPILLVSATHRYGPVAGLSAGILASLICLAVAAARGLDDFSILGGLAPDFILIGLIGGIMSSWPHWQQHLQPPAIDAWPALLRYSEAEVPFDTNPLASIESAARLLAEDDNPEELRQELVGIIVKECRHLSANITTLLQHVRDVATPEIRETDLAPILDAAVREADFVLSGKGVVLRKEIAPGIPSLECNPDQMRNLVTSLMISTARSEGAGSEVILDAQCRQNGVVLEVRAKGHGFRRFTNQLFSIPREVPAAGLALAQEIVRRHGGKIGAKTNLTKGLEYSVWLPLHCQDANGGWQNTSGGGR